MTRQQQNEIIIRALAGKVADMPNVQQVISRSFANWFQALVRAGTAQLQPQEEQPTEDQGAAVSEG